MDFTIASALLIAVLITGSPAAFDAHPQSDRFESFASETEYMVNDKQVATLDTMLYPRSDQLEHPA